MPVDMPNRYVNFHILQTLPYSNLNRDDVGVPKGLQFGGDSRLRISSQALARPARIATEVASDIDRTFRSKTFAKDGEEGSVAVDLTRRIAAACKEAGQPLTNEAALTKALEKKLATLTSGDGDGKKGTLIWVAEEELRKVATEYLDGQNVDGIDLGEIIGKTTRSLTIAARGRFFAAPDVPNIDAAMQVAHAFSVHAREDELDYFTAVNDLGDGSGAGHLNLAQYATGTFYRYQNLNRDQLLANWDDRDDPSARQRLETFLRHAMLALPTGKQNATAPHTLPFYILVTVSDQPLSYAPAFEQAVPAADEGGYETGAIGRLTDYAQRLTQLYPNLQAHSWTLNLHQPDQSVTFDTIVGDVAGWVLTGTMPDTTGHAA